MTMRISFQRPRALVDDAIAYMQKQLAPKWNEALTSQTIVVAAIACALLPLDLSQILFMIVGALCYSATRSARLPMKKRSAKAMPELATPSPAARDRTSSRQRAEGLSSLRPPSARGGANANSLDDIRRILEESHQAKSPGARPLSKTWTAQPIDAPVFENSSWDGQVGELLTQLYPTVESDAAVQQAASAVRHALSSLFPGCEVAAFASSDFRRCTAFGVAVPEVELVLKVDPEMLSKRQLIKGNVGEAESLKAQKWALRACTDCLVLEAGFKFRRSAFRSAEPKVTLLVPSMPGYPQYAVDLSINAIGPFRSFAILDYATERAPLAGALALLVRRWAKDRAIAHAPKGCPAPYLWNLLIVYFMQVGAQVLDGKPLLCAVDPTEVLPGGNDCRQGSPGSVPRSTSGTPKRRPLASSYEELQLVGSLFKDFVKFYSSSFKWGKEVVDVRTGQRKEVCGCGPEKLTIKDPFEPSSDWGASVTPAGASRVREEFNRALEICSRDGPLSELLELWSPKDDREEP